MNVRLLPQRSIGTKKWNTTGQNGTRQQDNDLTGREVRRSCERTQSCEIGCGGRSCAAQSPISSRCRVPVVESWRHVFCSTVVLIAIWSKEGYLEIGLIVGQIASRRKRIEKDRQGKYGKGVKGAMNNIGTHKYWCSRCSFSLGLLSSQQQYHVGPHAGGPGRASMVPGRVGPGGCWSCSAHADCPAAQHSVVIAHKALKSSESVFEKSLLARPKSMRPLDLAFGPNVSMCCRASLFRPRLPETAICEWCAGKGL